MNTTDNKPGAAVGRADEYFDLPATASRICGDDTRHQSGLYRVKTNDLLTMYPQPDPMGICLVMPIRILDMEFNVLVRGEIFRAKDGRPDYWPTIGMALRGELKAAAERVLKELRRP